MDSLVSDLIGGTEHLNLTLLVPVVFVIVGAVLVFAFGFKKPKEPQFKKIGASDNAAAAAAKKPKRKEKPTPAKSNGTTVSAVAATTRESTPAAKKTAAAAAVPKKEPKQQPQLPKKKETASPKKSAASKKPAATKPEKVRKPADFDDGEWTKVPSRTDKKKNKDDLILSQMVDSVLSKKTGDNKKKDVKVGGTVKNAKQLKDQENKTKKEAAEVNKKNIKNKTISADDNSIERIESIIVESKKLKENIDEIVNAAAAAAVVEQQKVQKFENLIANDEKSDDNKPVATSGGTVFNEMGDSWTEAKAPKKGKKKSRKE